MGWAFVSRAASTNVLVQTRVPDALLRRVTSVYTLVFFGAMPIGALVVGAAAARSGEVPVVLACATVWTGVPQHTWWPLPHLRQLA